MSHRFNAEAFRRLFEWLAENPRKGMHEWPEHSFIELGYSMNPACHYAMMCCYDTIREKENNLDRPITIEERDKFLTCDYCPIQWDKDLDCMTSENGMSHYLHAYNHKNWERVSEVALSISKRPVKEGVECV